MEGRCKEKLMITCITVQLPAMNQFFVFYKDICCVALS
jgi:hypothetical protein